MIDIPAWREAAARRIERAREAGIETMKFHASNMAAGPCPHATRMAGSLVPIDEAAPPPFADCTHPDQCGCLWQSWSDLMGE